MSKAKIFAVAQIICLTAFVTMSMASGSAGQTATTTTSSTPASKSSLLSVASRFVGANQSTNEIVNMSTDANGNATNAATVVSGYVKSTGVEPTGKATSVE